MCFNRLHRCSAAAADDDDDDDDDALHGKRDQRLATARFTESRSYMNLRYDHCHKLLQAPAAVK